MDRRYDLEAQAEAVVQRIALEEEVTQAILAPRAYHGSDAFVSEILAQAIPGIDLVNRCRTGVLPPGTRFTRATLLPAVQAAALSLPLAVLKLPSSREEIERFLEARTGLTPEVMPYFRYLSGFDSETLARWLDIFRRDDNLTQVAARAAMGRLAAEKTTASRLDAKHLLAAMLDLHDAFAAAGDDHGGANRRPLLATLDEACVRLHGDLLPNLGQGSSIAPASADRAAALISGLCEAVQLWTMSARDAWSGAELLRRKLRDLARLDSFVPLDRDRHPQEWHQRVRDSLQLELAKEIDGTRIFLLLMSLGIEAARHHFPWLAAPHPSFRRVPYGGLGALAIAAEVERGVAVIGAMAERLEDERCWKRLQDKVSRPIPSPRVNDQMMRNAVRSSDTTFASIRGATPVGAGLSYSVAQSEFVQAFIIQRPKLSPAFPLACWAAGETRPSLLWSVRDPATHSWIEATEQIRDLHKSKATGQVAGARQDAVLHFGRDIIRTACDMTFELFDEVKRLDPRVDGMADLTDCASDDNVAKTCRRKLARALLKAAAPSELASFDANDIGNVSGGWASRSVTAALATPTLPLSIGGKSCRAGKDGLYPPLSARFFPCFWFDRTNDRPLWSRLQFTAKHPIARLNARRDWTNEDRVMLTVAWAGAALEALYRRTLPTNLTADAAAHLCVSYSSFVSDPKFLRLVRKV